MFVSNRPRHVLLDSNLLLLLLVGSADESYVGKTRRLQAYGPDDFVLLGDVLGSFQAIVTTPHILTEVSNLIGHETDQIRNDTRTVLAEFLAKAHEESKPSLTLVKDSAYLRLGLTDAAIAVASALPAFVLTADLPLYLHIRNSGGAVENFNHIRSHGWK